MSCIASSSADCVFGVARLISSASTTLAKIGPGWNSKNVPPCACSCTMLRADDVGRHQVGRELNARELEVEHVGQRVHEARLADAGNALEQHVAARQQARHRRRDDLLVPDDAPADLGGDPDEPFAETDRCAAATAAVVIWFLRNTVARSAPDEVSLDERLPGFGHRRRRARRLGRTSRAPRRACSPRRPALLGLAAGGLPS